MTALSVSAKAEGGGGARLTVVARAPERAVTPVANKRCFIVVFMSGLESGEEFGKGHPESVGILLEG